MTNILDTRRFAVARPAPTNVRSFHFPDATAHPAPRLRLRWTIESGSRRLVGAWRLDDAEEPSRLPGRGDMLRHARFAWKLAA